MTLNQHPTTRFTGLAETYARHRPSYPSDAIDFIVAVTGINDNSLIVDVGCGTGISSRIFAERGFRVIGIEPNDDMRGQAESAEISGNARLTYEKGTAEATNIQSGTVDLVLSAQAFHWFDQKKSLAEFHRILRPGGWVTLMWNERDEADEFTGKFGDIFRTVRETSDFEIPRRKAGNALLECDLFEHRQRDLFPTSELMDEDFMIGRAFSASYAPKEDPEKSRFEGELRALFRQYARPHEDGGQPLIRMHYATSVYTGQRPEKV